MIKRMLTGGIVVACVYTWLFFSYIPAVLHIGALVLGGLATFEISRICSTREMITRLIMTVLSVLLLILPIPYYEYSMMLIFPFALIFFGFMMVRREQIREFNVTMAFVVSITVAALF